MLSSTHLSLSASRIVTTSTHLSLSSVAPQVEYLECPKVLEYSGLMAVSAKDGGGACPRASRPLLAHIVGAALVLLLAAQPRLGGACHYCCGTSRVGRGEYSRVLRYSATGVSSKLYRIWHLPEC